MSGTKPVQVTKTLFNFMFGHWWKLCWKCKKLDVPNEANLMTVLRVLGYDYLYNNRTAITLTHASPKGLRLTSK